MAASMVRGSLQAELWGWRPWLADTARKARANGTIPKSFGLEAATQDSPGAKSPSPESLPRHGVDGKTIDKGAGCG